MAQTIQDNKSVNNKTLYSSECPEGYFGNECAVKCKPPYYGYQCTKTCDCLISSCHFIHGCNNTPGR